MALHRSHFVSELTNNISFVRLYKYIQTKQNCTASTPPLGTKQGEILGQTLGFKRSKPSIKNGPRNRTTTIRAQECFYMSSFSLVSWDSFIKHSFYSPNIKQPSPDAFGKIKNDQTLKAIDVRLSTITYKNCFKRVL